MGIPRGDATVIDQCCIGNLMKDAIIALLRLVSALAPYSTLVMIFLLLPEFADPKAGPGFKLAALGGEPAGRLSSDFFTPTEMLTLAREEPDLKKPGTPLGDRPLPSALPGKSRWPSIAE